jgi:hypothetical protein
MLIEMMGHEKCVPSDALVEAEQPELVSRCARVPFVLHPFVMHLDLRMPYNR